MRLHRFYIQAALQKGQQIALSDEKLLHQMRSVFRFQPGDTVILFDGDGRDYVSEIVSLTKSEGVLRVTQMTENAWKPRMKLAIAISMIKKDNFEWIVEKATELGVSEIIPLISERSEKKGWNRERAERIMIEACEQSGRSDIPKLGEMMTLEDFMNTEKREVTVFHTENLSPIYETKANDSGKEIVALVGPEGGWSDKEVEAFRAKGYAIAKLSTPVLRAETAAIAIASVMLAGK
ncbi:MAG: RsmE family RNA methyltransferase [Candidatus Paceibacterota bacterium]|jgi:16S rRNA (uracil1498-N3)-methyltransferase